MLQPCSQDTWNICLAVFEAYGSGAISSVREASSYSSLLQEICQKLSGLARFLKFGILFIFVPLFNKIVLERREQKELLKVRSGLELILDGENGLGSVEIQRGETAMTLGEALGPILRELITTESDSKLSRKEAGVYQAPIDLPPGHWWWNEAD